MRLFALAAVLAAASTAPVYASSDRLECVAAAASGYLAPATVAACSDLVYASSDRLTCVADLAVATRDPLQVIDYCKTTHYSSADRLACVRAFR